MTEEANEESQPARETDTDPEDHRAIVREIHRELAWIHGIGGTIVLLVLAGLLIGAWLAGWIGSLLPWIGVVIVTLIGLIVVRMVVYRRADRLYDRLESYCQANDIDMQRLRDHYRDEELYLFFNRLFELKARRERLARGEPIDGEADEAP